MGVALNCVSSSLKYISSETFYDLSKSLLWPLVVLGLPSSYACRRNHYSRCDLRPHTNTAITITITIIIIIIIAEMLTLVRATFDSKYKKAHDVTIVTCRLKNAVTVINCRALALAIVQMTRLQRLLELYSQYRY